ncbi:hypothetical protein ZWY2020_005881 [Hordeum vulgare]|nr:hypothetical protein ZWY2020_005881 [Hordeum vulgare]
MVCLRPPRRGCPPLPPHVLGGVGLTGRRGPLSSTPAPPCAALLLPVIWPENPACRFRARKGMFAVGRLPAYGARMWTEWTRTGQSWWLTLLRPLGSGTARPLECEASPRCPTTLAYLGYGTELGSFYFVDAENKTEVPRPHLASVTLAPEQVLPRGLVISADLIQVELAAYIGDFRDSEFTWEVTETAPLIFLVPFPSAKLLRVCSHDFIRFPTNKFLISVHAVTAEPELVLPLEKVWVLVYGLPTGGPGAPQGGKLTHILKEISEPVVKLVTADLASFEDDGPACIEILFPASTEIDGLSMIFYFGSRGRHLTFELESPATADLHGTIPDAILLGDDGRDGDGARLRRTPSVRRMMVMAGSGQPRRMADVPRSPLLLALQAMLGWILGWRLGLGERAECGDGGVSFVIAALASGGLLFSLAGVPFPSLGIPGSGAVAAPGLFPAGCDP